MIWPWRCNIGLFVHCVRVLSRFHHVGSLWSMLSFFFIHHGESICVCTYAALIRCYFRWLFAILWEIQNRNPKHQQSFGMPSQIKMVDVPNKHRPKMQFLTSLVLNPTSKVNTNEGEAWISSHILSICPKSNTFSQMNHQCSHRTLQFDSWCSCLTVGWDILYSGPQSQNISLRPPFLSLVLCTFLRRGAAAVGGPAAGQKQCGNETAASAPLKDTSAAYDPSQSQPSDSLYGCMSNDVAENVSPW